MKSKLGVMAWFSDLKLVKTDQAIGKNSSSATPQPKMVASVRCRRVCCISAGSLQIDGGW